MTNTVAVMNHLEPEVLAGFLDGELSDEESQAVERHLLTCPACEERFIGVLPGPVAEPSAAVAGGMVAPAAVIATELGGLGSRLDAERRQAREVWRRLAALPAAERAAAIARDGAVATWGLVEFLVEESRRAAANDATRSLHLAELALAVAEALPESRYPQAAAAAAKSRAWAQVGNGRRIFGDYRAAERAFQRAEREFAASWLDPLDQGQLLQFRASLLRDLDRCGPAITLLEQAIAIYQAINEPHQLGRALISQGILHTCQDEFDAAEQALRRGLFLIDAEEDPRLLVCAQQHLILGLYRAGRPGEALALLDSGRELWRTAAGTIDRIRLEWLEAQILTALDRLDEAAALMVAVRSGLIAARLPYDAALACLELAMIYARWGKARQVRQLAAETLPILRLMDLEPALMAALIVFETAGRKGRLDLAVLRDLAARVEDARHRQTVTADLASAVLLPA